MLRRLFLSLPLALVFTLPALAEETANLPKRQISAEQIAEILKGNTIVGTWNGTAYSQFFEETGRTIYAPKGGRQDLGKWRVNTTTNQYESWWEQTGWTPYSIVMTNDGFAWVSRGALQPFKVLDGKQVPF